jgi:subtilase family serine protease
MQLAFQRLLEEQQSPSSSQYRHWLTPAEIGTKYGPVADEIDAISAWVRSQGLQVAAVSPARTTMTVVGPASSVAAALKVTLETYQMGGRARTAPANDPAIPKAFASVISGIAGLTEVSLEPSVSTGAVQAVDGAAGQARSAGARPLYTDPNTGVHSIAPGDFATIYDVASTTGAGNDGTGVRVAVLGQSDIVNSDITDLQSVVGLPQKAPNQMLVPGTTDPGLVLADQQQSTFEVGRVTTTAPGATVDLLIAGAADGGIATALQYNVDALMDPVMSISYSECEPALSGADVALYDSYFAQAAAEGISTFVTAGSSGAAGCAASFQAPPQTAPAKAMGNFLCSSSYVTCVGATEFNDAADSSLYWGTNGSNQSSALGYIPEGAWNEPINPASGNYQIAGTGSGASAYIAKPSWQSGTGVPNDGARDIPDVAFSGSEHDGYFGCLAAVGADCSQYEKTTFYGGPAGPASMAGVAAILGQKLARNSESGSTPAGLGNINPMLYFLASTTPGAFHDVSPVPSGADCSVTTPNLCNNSTPGPSSPAGGVAGDRLQVGYDLLTGLGSLDVGNFVNAAAALPAPTTTTLMVMAPATAAVGQSIPLPATLSPYTSAAGSATGTIYLYFNGQPVANGVIQGNGVSGLSSSFSAPGTYTVSAAYPGDLNFAGSVASTQVVVSAGPVVGMVVTASPSSITAGQSATFTATLPGNPAPTGTVQFFSNGAAIGGAVAVSGGLATTGSVNFPTAGTYGITAVYSGDTDYTTTTAGLQFMVNAAAPGNVQGFTVRAAPTTVAAGQSAVFTATLTGTPTPGGTVQFFSNGTAISSAVGLAGGVASTPAVTFPTAGNYTITAVYSGDASYVMATSTSLPFVVTAPALSTVKSFSVSANPGTITTGQSAVFTAMLAGSPLPTGTVQFFSNGTAISGSVAIVNGMASTPSIPFANAATYAITATYGGDGTYASTSSGALAFVVTTPMVVLPGIQLTASPSALSLNPGSTYGNSSTVTVHAVGGLSGTVAMSCLVTPVGNVAANAPTCTVTPSQLTLPAGGTATSMLSFATSMPQVAAGSAESPGPRGSRTSRISLAFLLVLLIPMSRRREVRARLGRLSALVPLMCLLLGSAALSGCGGTVGAALTSEGTTAGLYNVTVTATGSQVSATTVLSLTVK